MYSYIVMAQNWCNFPICGVMGVIVSPVVYRFCSHSIPVTGNTFQGPKQFPFLALLPAEVWSSILIDEVQKHY